MEEEVVFDCRMSLAFFFLLEIQPGASRGRRIPSVKRLLQVSRTSWLDYPHCYGVS